VQWLRYRLYYTPVRGLGWSIAACTLLVAAWTGGQAVQSPALDVRSAATSDPSAAADLSDEARAVAARLERWLDARALRELTIQHVPWYDPRVGTAEQSTVFVPTRWLAPDGDRAASRALIAGMTQRYWQRDGAPAGDRLSDGLRQYIATRAINEQLVGVNHFTAVLFGGFVTHVIRPVPLSLLPQDPRPPVRRFPELSATPETTRIVDAIYTLERYLGWPVVQLAVSEWLRSPTRSVNAFDDSIRGATAHDVRWFTSGAFNPGVNYDYAVTELTTGLAAGGAAPRYETALTIARLGDGIFPVDVAVVFADGSRVRERWDGRASNASFRYGSQASAVAAVVDPDLVLLLDRDRRNNAQVLSAPVHVPAVRWTVQWAVWLQDALLAATALL
jgi:hypothetical protein